MDGQIRISKDTDFTHLHTLELTGFENMATDSEGTVVQVDYTNMTCEIGKENC